MGPQRPVLHPGWRAHAYKRDLPDAEVVELDTGHFALEDRLPEISPRIADFMRRIAST
jgi:hypothetical protein